MISANNEPLMTNFLYENVSDMNTEISNWHRSKFH